MSSGADRRSAAAAFGNLLKGGALYFAIVFGAGFLLGPVRILWLAPRVGERIAELLEMPVMLAVSAAAARWIVGRFTVPAGMRQRLALGFLALLFMLLAEFGLVLRLRGVTITDYFAARDPVSGAAYYLSLLLFALFPALIGSRRIS